MTNPQPNPVRTLESHGVEDQIADDWLEVKSCSPDGTDHHMISIRTNGELVPYVERCRDCGWIDGASLNWWAQDAIKNQLSERAQRMAVASDTDPFAFVQSAHEDLDLHEVLGQALGAASTCWSEKQLFNVGEFDGSRATAVYEALVREVQRFQRLEVEQAVKNEHTRMLSIMRKVLGSGSATPVGDILTLDAEDRNPVNESNPSGAPASPPVPSEAPEV